MILLDTAILSELCQCQPSPEVMQWLEGLRDSEIFLSVVSIGEIERCLEKNPVSSSEFSVSLTRWIEDLLRLYGDRILPITPAISRCWGGLAAQLESGDADLLIAATALAHGLQIASPNATRFAPMGVEVINPFEARTGSAV